jgi:peptide/nickel transport system permease protein
MSSIGTTPNVTIARPAIRRGPLSSILRPMSRNMSLTIGGLIILGFVIMMIIGPTVIPYKPLANDANAILAAPSSAHLLGTDNFGRDILSRVVEAAKLDMVIAVAVTAFALVAGLLIGSFSGYMGGFVDDIIMRIVDIVLSFPAFILAVAITAMLGNNVTNVVLAIGIAYTPYMIRLVRSEVLSARESEYADAARCVGNPTYRVIFYHVLPNCLASAIVQATLYLGWAILDASALSFIGLGIKPPTAEWGVLVSEGAQYIVSGQWWTSFFPGLAILIAVLGFNLIGDGVRDRFSAR